MVAFNFGDVSNNTIQCHCHWIRFAKSCMLLDPFEECLFRLIGNEVLGLVSRLTRTANSSSSEAGIMITWLGAEAFGRIIVFIQDGVELMFF